MGLTSLGLFGGKDEKTNEEEEDEEPTQTNHQLAIAQDDAIDPIQFKPYQLANILDQKSFETLGGVEGLLRGLGTGAERGLSTEDASTRIHEKHEELPEIVLTEPSGNIGTPTDDRFAQVGLLR